MSALVEREFADFLAPKAPQLAADRHFPKVFMAKADVQGGDKKMSLFARSLNKAKSDGVGAKNSPDFDCASRLVDGSGLQSSKEAQNIHEENVERLKSMTREEIEESRKEVLQSVDPKLAEFLRRRVRTAPKQAAKTAEVPAIRPKKARLKGPLNMDKEEPEKMAWTADVRGEPATSGANFSARFDLEGKLLAEDAEFAANSALFHHGEEPSRAGYTPNELLTLSRSANLQQKALALRTLGAMATSFKRGDLDGRLDQNLLLELTNSGLILVARSALDDEAKSVREASLLCLRQLTDNQFDEAALDANYPLMSGHLQPSLPTRVVSDPDERRQFNKDSDALKDEEVIKVDVVKGLLRTDILQRIKHLLEEEAAMLADSSVANASCILARISRHSIQSASEVLRHPGLLGTLGKTLDAQKSARVTASVLKLARILCSWSETLAKETAEALNLPVRLTGLVARDSGQIGPTLESFRCWDCLLRRGLARELFLDLFPITMKFLVGLRAKLEPESAVDLDAEVVCHYMKVIDAAISSSGLDFKQFVDIHRIMGESSSQLIE